MACRVNADIWFRLKNGLSIKGITKNPYFWHDSFGKYFNRFIGCKLFGHKKTMVIADELCETYLDNSKQYYYCHKCERVVGEVNKK